MVFHACLLGSVLAIASPGFFEPSPISAAEAATPAQAEALRIQRHLRNVEETLRAQTPPDLTKAQRARRQQLLDILHRYWVAGTFPRNRDFPDRRVPYFIDADGTACAVGHLMLESDAEAMAREIATYENFDFVADIDHPGVGSWLAKHGLTAAEAAWIQPTYGPCGFSPEFVCGTDGNTYECEFIAVECAGVEVASVGACEDGTGTDGTGTGTTAGTSGGTTGNPEIIGPEICPEGTGSSGGTSSTTDGESTSSPTSTTEGGSAASGGTGDGSGSTSAASSTTSAGATDDSTDDKGCGCRLDVNRTSGPLGLLVLFALVRRRRDLA